MGLTLSDYIQMLKSADFNDNNLFKDLIAQVRGMLFLEDRELAREFTVSRPTVTRWRNGDCAPHPALRKHIYEFLIKKAQFALKQSTEKAFVKKRIAKSAAAGSRASYAYQAKVKGS